MKPMIGFLKTIWTMSVYIKENFKKWIGCISGAAKGLVGVITGTKSLSAIMSGLMTKTAIFANLLTLGAATAIIAGTIYLVSVIDRTLTRKVNESLSNLEQQTKKASDTMKNAFTQPAQDTAAMKDNMSSVADSTKKIKSNLQSFDVIHAIEQQAEMVAPETIIDIEMQDYSGYLDNLVREATELSTSITDVAIPKLDELKVTIGDVGFTIVQDIDTLRSKLIQATDSIGSQIREWSLKILEEITSKEPIDKAISSITDQVFTPKGPKTDLGKRLEKYIPVPTGGIFSMLPYLDRWGREHLPQSNEPKVILEIKESKYDYPDFITREYYINGKRVYAP